MQTPVKALLAVGCFTGVRGVGSGIRKVYLEQEEKSQDRAEGMGHFFLDGKKKICCWETEAEWWPSHRAPPQTLTGSPLVGLGPSLLIPAPQPTLAALEEVSRPCSSSPPREHAGPDLLIALCPVPCPARLLCLSWSSGGSRPGCLLGLLTHWLIAAALRETPGWAQSRDCAHSPCPHDAQAAGGREPDSKAPANQ